MEKKMLIEGMKCMHCKANVEKALKGVAGVTDAEVENRQNRSGRGCFRRSADGGSERKRI